MSRRFVCLAAVTAAVCGTAVPVAFAQPNTTTQSDSITATGTGQSRVLPKNRHSNRSIAAAYAAASKRAVKGALASAHDNALAYAAAGGMTLGSIESISDNSNGGFYYGPGPGFGPFGPGKFCGTIGQPVFKKVKGKRKLVHVKKVHRCIVPEYAYLTLIVSYAATPTTTPTTTTTTTTPTTTTPTTTTPTTPTQTTTTPSM